MKKLFFILNFWLLFLAFSVSAKTGIYIALLGGTANQWSPPPARLVAAYFQDRTSPLLFHEIIGYNHDFNRFVGMGMEIGMGQYGKYVYFFPENLQKALRPQTLEFFMQSQLHLPLVDVIGKIGGLRQTVKMSEGKLQESHTTILPGLGLSLAYNLTYRLAVIIGYERYFATKNHHLMGTDFRLNVSQIEGGLRYTFN